MINDYEAVIGLEVHVELKTKTKIFCSCKTDFGAKPNTQCCPVCMGMPGTLPVLNRRTVELAIKAGLATGCEIASYTKFDRKNYFYPDLPKAYQISQYDMPLCKNGNIDIGEKQIGITRIHLEEDAGKLLHGEKCTLIDYNRCGIPLIEIVSEPDMRSADEAVAYLKKLRSIMLYADISDCKMNEGSFRCDVNLSVRKKGSTDLGTRTEMKNINSFQFVAKAIEYEFARQVQLVESGGTVTQETRRFDEESGTTAAMRTKENANDYRYFPEPDIPPLAITNQLKNELASQIPTLPDERVKLYSEKYGIRTEDALVITAHRSIADCFEVSARLTSHPVTLSNLFIGEIVKIYSDENCLTAVPTSLAAVADMAGSGKISFSAAKQLVRELCQSDFDVNRAVAERELEQINDVQLLTELANKALSSNAKAVADYKNGKKGAIKSVVGAVMGMTKGKANGELLQQILTELIEKM